MIALSSKAMGAVQEIARKLGVSEAEAIGRALGTEIYLLCVGKGDDAIINENKSSKNREEMTVARGDAD